MSTLRVWCERCRGTGGDPDAPTGCSICRGFGYIAREVVELPDGRAVVVTKETWEAFREACCESWGSGDTDGEALRIASALFTGGVYEAEAVGRLTLLPGDEPTMVLMPEAVPTEAGTAPIIDDGDLIAIGLKEVGRGKA